MFIRIDDVVLNTGLIECVLPNKVVTKCGEDWYDKDEFKFSKEDLGL